MHCLGLDGKHRAKGDFSTPSIRVGILEVELVDATALSEMAYAPPCKQPMGKVIKFPHFS